MLPVVGVTQPLISYGGSSALTVMLALGLVEHSPNKRHFSLTESHLQMSDNRSWTKPLARRLGGSAIRHASV